MSALHVITIVGVPAVVVAPVFVLKSLHIWLFGRGNKVNW